MRVAVITGAASGIGLALSLVYLQKGIIVVMTDKDVSKLNNEAKQLMVKFPDQVFHTVCDITKIDEVNQLTQLIAKKWGRVDWIYNNAGIIGNLAPVWDLKPEQISQVMDVNLYGMINVIRAFVPLLFKQKFNSHIINIASLYALCSGSQMASYAMSKHAVLALSESLYFDLQRLDKPVDLSVAFPSFTDTSLLSGQSAEYSSAFHESLSSLMSHSRPAMEVAQHIVQEVEQKRFYIMPDKEVKGYCEERTKAILLQETPHHNNVEKLISSLLKRKKSIV
ncbi:short-chain dehydrogenase [Legionella antarctica]|uniref:Short-chain dehydrogenase n=1 Tax=Legionella antarctica TaxID=2708020 RepID=A0A6F8T3S3_9GAMM|nr:SDR family oxidoreductase [Legionella antarctica]BCA95048.1 short-chain dehydrogenase [Legionella antarctica]